LLIGQVHRVSRTLRAHPPQNIPGVVLDGGVFDVHDPGDLAVRLAFGQEPQRGQGDLV
jgi:hypothetical protein